MNNKKILIIAGVTIVVVLVALFGLVLVRQAKDGNDTQNQDSSVEVSKEDNNGNKSTPNNNFDDLNQESNNEFTQSEIDDALLNVENELKGLEEIELENVSEQELQYDF